MSRTEYFTKAHAYQKYRWDYSKEATYFIKLNAEIGKSTVILDVGAGTGKLTKHFDSHVDTIYAVEPDSNMFEILENQLDHIIPLKRFSDEIPEIPDGSVDVILSAHALHWFDFKKTIIEFNRIASKNCKIFSVENQNISSHPLFKATGELLKKYTIDVVQQKHDHINIENYFHNKVIKKKSFEFNSDIDFEIYFGSLLSISFLPNCQDENFIDFKNDAKALYDKCVLNGKVETRIKTTVRYGLLATPPPYIV